MKVRVEFEIDNAAFWYEDDEENRVLDRFVVAEVIRDAALKVENGNSEGKLYDYNGNYVGSYVIE